MENLSPVGQSPGAADKIIMMSPRSNQRRRDKRSISNPGTASMIYKEPMSAESLQKDIQRSLSKVSHIGESRMMTPRDRGSAARDKTSPEVFRIKLKEDQNRIKLLET